ncbi:beta-ketoacyl-ACP synthase [Mesorhizobium xinjiangense]|uniref:beta-ketoacyl-ACP synthase n=1 Tax=Mesorhizobium xinjiangense TaxID=2678685 RepID=UPI0012ED6B08|nr:beta-ketoacyl-ACP synthase [Mesorhizobium xinjiangense]
MTEKDVVITGIGIVSSLGEGPEAHWRALSGHPLHPVIDSERFKPYTVHPLPPIEWSQQIPKRGDQRQMEVWQRLGTYCAGLALDDAGMKGDEAQCTTMDMVVAAGGGERDQEVDTTILEASLTRNDREILLNEKLTTELRPTLFLAQLSNLLAGNISIVHKVTGSSRTFMGEEGSGVSAVETAVARIRSGQSSHLLVGAAFQTEHPDHLLAYELAGKLHRGSWKPVWSRQGAEGGGMVSGSGGAFLVLESRAHAEARGATIYAMIDKVSSARSRRGAEDLDQKIGALIDGTLGRDTAALAISGASGAHEATAAEKAAIDRRGHLTPRGFATMTGHLKEAQFPFGVALAALAIKNEAAYPPFDSDEKPFDGHVDTVLATAVGHERFEGAARVTKA